MKYLLNKCYVFDFEASKEDGELLLDIWTWKE